MPGWTSGSTSLSGSGQGGNAFLDIDTVIKASQAISGEINLELLLEKLILILIEVVEYSHNDVKFYRRFSPLSRGVLIASFIVILLMGMSNEPTQFIYFQF